MTKAYRIAPFLLVLSLALTTVADTRENPRNQPGDRSLIARVVKALRLILVPNDGPMPPHP